MKTWKKSESNETYVYKQGGMRFGIRQSRSVSMRPHSCLLWPSVRLRASPLTRVLKRFNRMVRSPAGPDGRLTPNGSSPTDMLLLGHRRKGEMFTQLASSRIFRSLNWGTMSMTFLKQVRRGAVPSAVSGIKLGVRICKSPLREHRGFWPSPCW